jgi:hypothetical protein
MAKLFKTAFAYQGTKEQLPADAQVDGKASFAEGFTADYALDYGDADARDIAQSELNGIFHDITEAIGELQQYGVAVWQSDMSPIAKYSLVFHDDKLWQAKKNTSATPAQGSDWQQVDIAYIMSLLGTLDLSAYATKTYVDNSVSGLASKSYVDAGLATKATASVVNAQLASKFNKTDVVQGTGQSTVKVMSQKAVTDAISDAAAGQMSWGGITGDIENQADLHSALATKITKPVGFDPDSGDTAKYLSGKGTLEKAVPVSPNDDAQYVQVNGNLHNNSTIEFAQSLPSSTDLFSLKKGIYRLGAMTTYVNSPPLPINAGETYKLIVFGDSYVDSYAGKTVCSAIVIGKGVFYYTDPSQLYGTAWHSAASFVPVPANPTSTGSKGQIAADDDYVYVCYAENAWISVPKKEFLDSKVDKIQAKVIVTADKVLTAADSGKLLIINADGITITLPASSDFNIDIAKMDEDFITIVECAGTDNFREESTTISVIRDVSITNSGIAGKEWLAIGAYEV